MFIVPVSVPGTNAGVTPPPYIPGSVMLAETVKDSVPSTRKSSKTSMKTEMGPRVAEPRSNVTSFLMRQKSPAVGFIQSVAVEEVYKKHIVHSRLMCKCSKLPAR